MQSTSKLTPSGQISGVGSSGWFSSVFQVLTTPACWIQNHDYSREWDDELNRLMRTERFTDVNYFTAKIGGHLVWVANHPYASLTLREREVRPSRVTILRAHRKLIADVMVDMTRYPMKLPNFGKVTQPGVNPWNESQDQRTAKASNEADVEGGVVSPEDLQSIPIPEFEPSTPELMRKMRREQLAGEFHKALLADRADYSDERQTGETCPQATARIAVEHADALLERLAK